MRAVTLDAFDSAPAARDDLPDPTVAADGLVVRVRASLGSDYAGTVEAIGAEVEGYAVGELIALTPRMQVASKPASLDLATAGVAPLAGIAALAAVDALALSEGETIRGKLAISVR